MTPLLLAVLLAAQDTLLVSVELAETQERILVEAVLEADSTLRLPAEPVYRLLGIGAPPAPWVTADQLREAYPPIVVVWLPLELRLVILDRLRVLPASRNAHAQLVARTGMALGVPVQSGPFVSFTADEDGQHATDLGYSWKGRLWLAWRESSTRGSAWTASLAPSPKLYLSYSDGEHQGPQANARLALGPTWISTQWMPESWHADALLRLGRVFVFGSTREAFAVTFNAAPVGVQAGWTGDKGTLRLTYGPVMPSPFSIPNP